MTSFPKLSYECPMRWDTMRGDERERHCSKCSHTVVNISLLTTAEREALLANPPAGGLCVAYYQRLSGECVSAEKPLTATESRRVVQWGALAASAAAFATAAHFAPQAGAGMAPAATLISQTCDDLKAKGQEVLYDLGIMRPPVYMIMGMVSCPPLTSSPVGAPPSSAPAPVAGDTIAETSTVDPHPPASSAANETP